MELNEELELRKLGVIVKTNDIEKKINSLKNLENIQGSKGNIDQGDYMVGLYNGLEIAVALLENREPNFVDINIE
ncbi:hypothetical protein [Brassicibacter mesophilus]|uniref:hypothetical protein n=1 Tax=Brassicibacter mesophilus TaxID=745119 RepID=UPI003D2492B2